VLDLGILYVPFGVLLLVGTTNAVNLTDGLDGLATGLVILVGLTFTALSYLAGRVDFAEYLQIPFLSGAGELSVFALALVGACVGFLWFNAHPAEVMMGDTGSLSLGGAIGVMAMMIKKEILLVVVGGVFVLEAASVIIQVASYKLRGKRVFKMAPLHHHFELIGWAESKVVLRLWILGGLFAILSLSTLKLR
jgi:phospho-N-acetylmuramoyl-pentapeptide-transferase